MFKNFKKHFMKAVEVKVLIYYSELLKNRYALIASGNSGIGFAIAEVLLRNRANVIIASRNEDKLLSTHKKLSQISTESRIDFVFA